jgi:hypothetical protein
MSRVHLGARPYTSMRKTGECTRCKETKRLQARRLCGACYEWARRTGNHVDFERVHRSSADLVEDHDHLAGAGATREQIAERLGYANAESLRTALHFARRQLERS